MLNPDLRELLKDNTSRYSLVTAVAKRAREVISKNITTVQEIASLLGEHMVETELLLSSIAEGFDPNSNEGK